VTTNNSFEEDQRNERRQMVHISSEQKRRGNINSGFEMLQTMIPSMNPNLKVSKAQILQKATEHILKLKTEREKRRVELDNLKREAEAYSKAITDCQNALPATGVPFTDMNANTKEQQSKFLWKLYRDYVRNRTLENWKFWVLSKLLTPLFDTYVIAVTALMIERTEDLINAMQKWMEKHCSLTALRPMIMNALRKLSTTTTIINSPDRLPQQAVDDVSKDQN
jgi:MAX-like protein X